MTDREAKRQVDGQGDQRHQKTGAERKMKRLALDREMWVRKNVEDAEIGLSCRGGGGGGSSSSSSSCLTVIFPPT